MPSLDKTSPDNSVRSTAQSQEAAASGGFLDRTILRPGTGNWGVYLAVILFAAAVYLACAISPPSLQDDVDAVQAQISRNMITSGDWVTPRLDGVIYLEKPPLIYWMMARELQGVRRPRLGCANSCRLIGHRAVLAHGCIWRLGVRQARRILRRALHGNVRRTVAVYPSADSRRDADRHDRIGDVGAAARAGRRRTASPRLGLRLGCESGHRPAAEEPDRRGVSGCRRA